MCYTSGWCVTHTVPAVVLGGLIPWITHTLGVPVTQCSCVHPSPTQDLYLGLQACGPTPS